MLLPSCGAGVAPTTTQKESSSKSTVLRLRNLGLNLDLATKGKAGPMVVRQRTA